MVAVGLPVVVDGVSVDTGTPWDAAWRDGAETAINDKIDSPTNPLETPVSIIDEVVTARGSKDSLGERLDVCLEPDGTPVLDNLTKPHVLSHLFLKNFVINDLLEAWSQGDTSAPDGWELSGAGASIVRTGAGLADTRAPLIGRWCAKVTAGGGAPAYLRQKIVPAAVMAYLYQLQAFLTQDNNAPQFRCLGQAWAIPANIVDVFFLVDSLGEQIGDAGHQGGSDWERLFGGASILNALAADNVYVGYKIQAGQTAYVGPLCATLCPSTGGNVELGPRVHIPCEVERGEKAVHFVGSPGTGARKWSWAPRRPGIIIEAVPYAGTAPGAGGLVFDVNTYDGAALTTAFTTKPTCANGVSFGPALAPDGTYARRCFTPKHTAGLAAGALVTVDIDAENSAADYGLTIGYLHWVRPFEALWPFNAV